MALNISSRIPVIAQSLLLVWALSCCPSFAETATAPIVKAPAKSIKPSDAVAQTIVSEVLEHAALARLDKEQEWKGLVKQLDVLESDLDVLIEKTKVKDGSISPQFLDHQIVDIQRRIAEIITRLEVSAQQIEADSAAINEDAQNWDKHIKLFQNQDLPDSIIKSAQSIEQRLLATGQLLHTARNKVLLILSRAFALQERSSAAYQVISKQLLDIHLHYLDLEKKPIWELSESPAGGIQKELLSAWNLLATYVAQRGVVLGEFSVLILLLSLWLFKANPKKEVPRVERAYGLYFSASFLILLMALGWLAPSPPALFYETLVLLAPIPAARLLNRALPIQIPYTLYGIAVSTILISIRHFVEDGNVIDRTLLLLQTLCIGLAFGVDLKLGLLQKAFPKFSDGLIKLWSTLIVMASIFTALGAVIGFKGPLSIFRIDIGGILGIAMVYCATAMSFYGWVLALLETPVLNWLNCARNKDPVLLRAIRMALIALTISGVLMVSVGALDLAPFLTTALQSIMDSNLVVGSVSISAHSIVLALGLLLTTFVATGVTGFILEFEVMPRLTLRSGTKFAILTFTRWIMIIIGVILTMASIGLDMTKVTLVAGALSVGIGFGLQNVVNNFVSGLILIIERPVGVGDVIDWGTRSGTVTRIGIRSSTVRTKQGAEILVPNGELVSQEVVNWTRSDRHRRYDINIGVAAGSNPEEVMHLLEAAADTVPEIMKVPAPKVIFKGFDNNSLNFTLLAWVSTVDVGMQAQNALQLVLLKKLADAGIAAQPYSGT